MTPTTRRTTRQLWALALLLVASCGSTQAAFATSGAIRKSDRIAFPSSSWKIRDESSVALNAFAGVQDQTPALAAGAAVLIALVAGVALNKNGVAVPDVAAPAAEPEPVEIVDLSIPYDAAARLAYDEWRVTHGREAFDEVEYQKFKVLYEEKAVADVIVKQKTRALEAL